MNHHKVIITSLYIDLKDLFLAIKKPSCSHIWFYTMSIAEINSKKNVKSENVHVDFANKHAHGAYTHLA